MADITNEIHTALTLYNGEWKEKNGVWKFSAVIAERKAFLTRKKLTYTATMRIDDAAKAVKFSEMLTEVGSGFGNTEGGISTGFGVKTETYNTFKGPRQGTIEEQSRLFGKDYTYTFNYSEIRSKIQAVAGKYGYTLDYQVLAVK